MIMLAPIYLIISGVCSITVLIEVLGRFLNLFMLISVAPTALSTLSGGRGIENSAIAWFKSFLTSTLQIIVIGSNIITYIYAVHGSGSKVKR